MNQAAYPLDDTALEQFRRRHQIDPQHVRRFRNAMLKSFASDTDVAAVLPHSDELQLHSLTLASQHDSMVDGATRLLFDTRSDLRLETVILRIGQRKNTDVHSTDTAGNSSVRQNDAERRQAINGRTTVCVSSQVGCAAACSFCATGQMKVARNLSTVEILDQVVQAGQLLRAEGRSVNNVVFMGMGEPFHNESAVCSAVEQLLLPSHFDRSPRQILVSTVGIPDAMVRFAKRFPAVNLALSLHSVRPEIRRSLIPLADRYPLKDLHAAIETVNEIQNRPVMIEYLMLDQLNDSTTDSDLLCGWLAGLNCRINLIPFNPVSHAPQLNGSPEYRIQAFAETLRSAGFETTVRYSLGRDVAAACGQLIREQQLKRPFSRGPQ
ncbi:MAG: 23S rRNA (adenine(2503)-C(2))-methyltransferase RlmN [Fuerstiella sp.]